MQKAFGRVNAINLALIGRNKFSKLSNDIYKKKKKKKEEFERLADYKKSNKKFNNFLKSIYTNYEMNEKQISDNCRNILTDIE